MMEADLISWVAVLFRFVHVLTAIMWIGNSLLFTWMEFNLQKPAKDGEGDLLGTLDMLHGGGVYHLEKRILRPGAIPAPLHWFMWQSYTTWLSGFVLMGTLYLTGSGTFFLDATKTAMPGYAAVLWSLGGLGAGWLVYDQLWRSPLKKKPFVAVSLSLALLFAAAWFFNTMFNGRAVYLQIGAMMGTMMSANVFFHIIANQHKFMAALESGRPHDGELGKAAKSRSLHNHYMTFPVLFLMLSAHFSQLYSAEWNVPILAVIVLSLMFVKFLMNSRYQFADWLHAIGGTLVFAFAAIYILLALPDIGRPDADSMADTGKRAFLGQGCAACHMQGSSELAPQLTGIYGTMQTMNDGAEVMADAAYLRESITHPQTRIVKGYAAAMPAYASVLSPEQIEQLVAYIRSMGPKTK